MGDKSRNKLLDSPTVDLIIVFQLTLTSYLKHWLPCKQPKCQPAPTQMLLTKSTPRTRHSQRLSTEMFPTVLLSLLRLHSLCWPGQAPTLAWLWPAPCRHTHSSASLRKMASLDVRKCYKYPAFQGSHFSVPLSKWNQHRKPWSPFHTTLCSIQHHTPQK